MGSGSRQRQKQAQTTPQPFGSLVSFLFFYYIQTMFYNNLPYIEWFTLFRAHPDLGFFPVTRASWNNELVLQLIALNSIISSCVGMFTTK